MSKSEILDLINNWQRDIHQDKDGSCYNTVLVELKHVSPRYPRTREINRILGSLEYSLERRRYKASIDNLRNLWFALNKDM